MTCPSICQSHEPSICHTTNMTHPYICQSHQSSNHHTVDTKGPSICQPHESPVRHTTMTTCPSICQPYTASDHHTNFTTSPSVCQSQQSSARCTIEQTSPSVCQSRDSSVCYPTRDVRHAVCLSSVTSVLPSANTMVNIPMSIPVRNFPYYHDPGKFPFVRTSMESSVHHQDSLSVNSSPFAANPLKIPRNYGENSSVNYMHENPVKSPTICASYIPFVRALYVQPIRTSCVTSDVAPVRASSIQPICTSCVTSDVALTEFLQPIQVQSHLDMPGILVQLGHIQRT